MSYKEVIEDGIRIEKRSTYSTAYYPPCHRCGRETFSMSYISGNKYTCNICKLKKVSKTYDNRGMARMRKL